MQPIKDNRPRGSALSPSLLAIPVFLFPRTFQKVLDHYIDGTRGGASEPPTSPSFLHHHRNLQYKIGTRCAPPLRTAAPSPFSLHRAVRGAARRKPHTQSGPVAAESTPQRSQRTRNGHKPVSGLIQHHVAKGAHPFLAPWCYPSLFLTEHHISPAERESLGRCGLETGHIYKKGTTARHLEETSHLTVSRSNPLPKPPRTTYNKKSDSIRTGTRPPFPLPPRIHLYIRFCSFSQSHGLKITEG